MMNHSKTFGGIRHPAGRKALALLLAALMTLSTAAPAFADLFAFVTVGEEDKNAETAYGEGVLTAYTDEYDFRLEYFEDSKIPENTELYVSEIPEGSELYEKYLAAAEKTYAFTDKTVFARFFDICLINPETGEPVEPEGLVDVTIAGEEVASVDLWMSSVQAPIPSRVLLWPRRYSNTSRIWGASLLPQRITRRSNCMPSTPKEWRMLAANSMRIPSLRLTNFS